MTSFSTASRPDPRAVDFEAFYEDWYPRALRECARGGLSDPEASAQELLLVFWKTDYLQKHDPALGASLDTWVGNIIRLRIKSMQRQELRRRTIAPQVGEAALEMLPAEEQGYSDLKLRWSAAGRIIEERYPEWLPLWGGLVQQILMGQATITDVLNRRELAGRVRLSVAELEEALEGFVDMVCSDSELAGLLGADRAPATG